MAASAGEWRAPVWNRGVIGDAPAKKRLAASRSKILESPKVSHWTNRRVRANLAIAFATVYLCASSCLAAGDPETAHVATGHSQSPDRQCSALHDPENGKRSVVPLRSI